MNYPESKMRCDDAQRYRAIRKLACADPATQERMVTVMYDALPDAPVEMTPELFDKAIDALCQSMETA